MVGTALGLPAPARALDANWTGAVDGNFGNGANWMGGMVPDGIAHFSGTSPHTALNNVTLGTSFGGFDNLIFPSGPFTFSDVTGNFTSTGVAQGLRSAFSVAAGGTLGFLNSATAGTAVLNAVAAGSGLVFGGTSSGETAAVTLEQVHADWNRCALPKRA
jgi:hypothetical protein